MKTSVLVILLSIAMFNGNAQYVRCTELLDFVAQNGYYKGEVSSLMLINSSWLRSVKAYQYKNSVFVVAEIITD